jgi:MoxR-like ATPase
MIMKKLKNVAMENKKQEALLKWTKNKIKYTHVKIKPQYQNCDFFRKIWNRREMIEFKSDVEAVEAFNQKYAQLRQEVGKVIVGQDEVLKNILITIFSRGHVLLIGVPGLAKTLMVTTIAKALGLSCNRIQFTPDLMPSDIMGTEILDENRNFRFLKGPVFSNIVLADEIKRTPPKTQSALLEAMQERSVSIAGVTHKLPDPFFVLATQNPIEQEEPIPCPKRS